MQVLDFPEVDFVTLPPEGDDDMPVPTNKERLDGLEKRLGEIEVALGLTPPEPKRSFLKQKYEWIINHKGTSLVLTIILCVVGIWGKYWIDHKNEWRNGEIDSRVRHVLEEHGGIKETLSEVRDTVNRTETKLNTLEPFIHDLIQKQFDNAAKLSPTVLQQRLPAIQHLAAVAKDQGVKVDPKILILLSRKLSVVNPTAVGFWPTAAEFISYRSQQFKGWQETNLPLCDDQFHKAEIVKQEKNVITHGPVEVHDCKIILDSPSAAVNLSIDLSIASVNFRRCAVFYNGGPVVIFPVKMAITTPAKLIGELHFYDCVFVFSLLHAPPPDGQHLTRSLLAATSNTVKVGPS